MSNFSKVGLRLSEEGTQTAPETKTKVQETPLSHVKEEGNKPKSLDAGADKFTTT